MAELINSNYAVSDSLRVYMSRQCVKATLSKESQNEKLEQGILDLCEKIFQQSTQTSLKK